MGLSNGGEFSERDIVDRFRPLDPQTDACFDALLVSKPNARGAVNLRMSISGDGATEVLALGKNTLQHPSSEAHGDLKESPVFDCLKTIVERVRWPKSRDGKPMGATVTFGMTEWRKLPALCA